MSGVGRERALFIGLAALQDYVDQAREAPLPATLQLRALLALLAVHGGGETDAYCLFWETARKGLDPADPYRDQQNYIRGMSAQTQWIGIARDLGLPAVSVEFCNQIYEMVQKARGGAVGAGRSAWRPSIPHRRDKIGHIESLPVDHSPEAPASYACEGGNSGCGS